MPGFRRKRLRHETPDWVEDGAVFFLTINSLPRGGSQLVKSSEVSKGLVESVRHRMESRIWYPHLLVLMPDHLHLLVSFAEDPGMIAAVAGWKRWTARQLGIEWQEGFFDHRLRTEESLEEKTHYLRMNPVRAGLVEDPISWPHTYTFDS